MRIVKYWTMKDGQEIPICAMTDDHLQNAIAMCERSADRYMWDDDDFIPMSWEYYELRKEQDYRHEHGIKVPPDPRKYWISE